MAIMNPSIKYKVLSIKGSPFIPYTSYSIPPEKRKRGFALIIAVIFMAVMLSFGLALGSLGYKQQVLASSATQSQYAFYSADSALECALYADQQLGTFTYNSNLNAPAPIMTCSGAVSASTISHTSSLWVILNRVSIDSTRCVDVTIYKPAPGTGSTLVYSQGYDVSCSVVASPSGARLVSRGLYARY